MTILLWLALGLVAGAVARRFPDAPESGRRLHGDLALGLFASIAGGLLALFLA